MSKANAKPLITSLLTGDTLLGIQGGKLVQFQRSLLGTAPQNIIDAEAAGVVYDANPTNNTGTDNTAALNALLAGGNIHLRINGPCLADNVKYTSNTIVEFTAAGNVFKKGAPNSGQPLWSNLHPVAGPTTPIDQNITFINPKWDGNRRNYGSGNTLTSGVQDIITYARYCNNSGYVQPTVRACGVKNLTVIGGYVYDSPAYGIQLSNVQGARFFGWQKWSAAGDHFPGNDVFHMNGYCTDIVAYGVSGSCSDDFLAFNANDGNDINGADIIFEPGTVAAGPISVIRIFGANASQCAEFARFLSGLAANSISDVEIIGGSAALTGLDGTNGYNGLYFDDLDTGDGTHGLVDGVKVRDIVFTGNCTSNQYPIYFNKCNVQRAEFSGLRNKAGTQAPSSGNANATFLYAGPSAKLGRVKLLECADESTAPVMPSINLSHASADLVEVVGHEYDLAVAGQLGNYPQPNFQDVPAIWVRSNINRLHVRRPKIAGVSQVVKSTGAVINDLIVEAPSLLASKGGPVVQSDTAIPRYVYGIVDADAALSIPGTSVGKGDGTGYFSTLLLRDLTVGTSGTLLHAHTADIGGTWGAGQAGGALKMTGDGFVYCGGSSSYNYSPVGPPNGSYTFEADYRLMSGGFGNTDWMEAVLLTDGTPSEFYGLSFAGNRIAVVQTNGGAVYQTTSTMPALGVVWRIRCQVIQTSTNHWTIRVTYSTDGGRTYASLLADSSFVSGASVTATTPFLYGLSNTNLSTGWTPTTGPHIGRMAMWY